MHGIFETYEPTDVFPHEIFNLLVVNSFPSEYKLEKYISNDKV